MDAAMLELLQRQLAGDGNLQEVLAGMVGSGATAGTTDPALGLLSQMLAKREQELEKTIEVEARWNTAELEARERELEARRQEAAHQAEERQARMERLRQRFAAMSDELEACRARLDDLALALGACPNCWGEEGSCRLCRGRGRPGYLRVDPTAFTRWVAPALQGRDLKSSTGSTGASAPERISS